MRWEREPEFTTANRAERCRIGDFELVAYDLPAGRGGPRVIGWEVFGPPRRQRLLARGDSKTFDDAKKEAETAFGRL
jgi:hypothetical protein